MAGQRGNVVSGRRVEESGAGKIGWAEGQTCKWEEG